MNRPIQVHLPASFAMGELIAAQSTVLASLGWDLGMKFDVHMRPIHGSGWVEVLRLDRWEETGQSLYKFKLTLVDPSFTITEPLKNSHSPLRECLPRTQAFFDLLESTWRIRNAAQHFDPPMTAGLLQDRVKVIGHLSQQAGLALATDCKRILERINHIGQGGKVVPPAVVLEDLQSTLASEREATKQLSVQIDQLKKALGEADRSSTQSAELQGEVERLRADLIAAEAERSLAVDSLGTTRTAVHATSADLRRSATDRILDIAPGDPWPRTPGSRILRLMPHVGDLYDPAREELLSDTVGQSSIDASVLWRRFIPNGGVVHLSDAGQACTLIGATYVYLGSLDDGSGNES